SPRLCVDHRAGNHRRRTALAQARRRDGRRGSAVSREIITVDEMRAIDEASLRAGMTTLMENAGRAVAEAITARFPPRPTAVLCGPGNNGGDGWVAARALREAGWPVWVETLVARDALTGDAAQAAKAYAGEVRAIGADNPMAELFVDALFGAGLSRG